MTVDQEYSTSPVTPLSSVIGHEQQNLIVRTQKDADKAFTGQLSSRREKLKSEGSCKCPRPYRLPLGLGPDGVPIIKQVACLRPSCPVCGRAAAWGIIEQVESMRRSPEFLGRTAWNAQFGLKHSLVDRTGKTPAEMRSEAFTLLTEATRAAVKDLSAGSKGYRRGGWVRPMYPALSIKRLTVKDLSQSGHPHLHSLMFVTPKTPGEQLPGLAYTQEHLLERVNHHAGRMAGRNRHHYFGVNQVISLHLEETESVEASLRYFLLAENRHWKDGAWRFPSGTRRVSVSPGLTPERRKRTNVRD